MATKTKRLSATSDKVLEAATASTLEFGGLQERCTYMCVPASIMEAGERMHVFNKAQLYHRLHELEALVRKLKAKKVAMKTSLQVLGIPAHLYKVSHD